ncbi:glycosyltransferase family 4 protein [Spirulina sp. CCNP1310]|nr:glycosyltransferase family 4 protein [Spirulina sp. CCNP1310]
MMKILMISAPFPYPPSQGGTQVRTFNLLKQLSQDHAITLVTQRSGHVTDADIAQLREYVAELQVFPPPSPPLGGKWRKGWRFGQAWLTGVPAHIRSQICPQMRAWVAAQAPRFTVITAEHTVNEVYLEPQWRDRAQVVANLHSSLSATVEQMLAAGTSDQGRRDRLNLPLLRRYEQGYCGKFSHLVVTTPEDRAQFQRLSPNTPITVIPNGVDLDLFPMRTVDPGGAQLMFMGAMDNQPNIDAAQFLCREILPPLRAIMPDVTVALVGARPGPAVQALGALPGVTVWGKVAVMVEALHEATLCVIPMRSGFGIKNKTLEALAAGVPVVGSDRALEGLTIDPQGAIRANTVGEFVAAIAGLLRSPEQRQALAQAGRQYIETHFTWQAAAARYATVLAGAMPPEL